MCNVVVLGVVLGSVIVCNVVVLGVVLGASDFFVFIVS